MKQILCLILIFSFLLSGCGFFGERIKDPVTFYYLCEKYQEELCCVIGSEEREASGHTGDLPYLLALYQMGPTDDELLSPLPAGTHINTQIQDGHVTLELSDSAHSLSDIDYSLACACLTLTCLNATNAVDVTVRSGDRVKTMTHDSLTLLDTIETIAPVEEIP